MDTITINEIEVRIFGSKLTDFGDGKVIKLKTELSAAEFENIKNMAKDTNEYFVVEFKNQKLNVRLGRTYWDLVNSKYVCHITLVEEIFDKSREKNTGNTFDVKIIEEQVIIKNISLLRELINLLRLKNILNNDEVKKLFQEAEENEFDRKYETFQVKDIDKYDL